MSSSSAVRALVACVLAWAAVPALADCKLYTPMRREVKVRLYAEHKGSKGKLLREVALQPRTEKAVKTPETGKVCYEASFDGARFSETSCGWCRGGGRYMVE